jgi:hypothetical protein
MAKNKNISPRRVHATGATVVVKMGQHKGHIHLDVRLTVKEEKRLLALLKKRHKK